MAWFAHAGCAQLNRDRSTCKQEDITDMHIASQGVAAANAMAGRSPRPGFSRLPSLHSTQSADTERWAVPGCGELHPEYWIG